MKSKIHVYSVMKAVIVIWKQSNNQRKFINDILNSKHFSSQNYELQINFASETNNEKKFKLLQLKHRVSESHLIYSGPDSLVFIRPIKLSDYSYLICIPLQDVVLALHIEFMHKVTFICWRAV